jgi:hypothetical protein
MKCVEFNALPEEARVSPEDAAALALAMKNKWQKCPGCGFLVGLTTGCNHMTCT